MLKNKIKTLILLSALSGLLMSMGFYLGGNLGLEISIIIAFSINFISYFFSDKIVLKMYNAKLLDKKKHARVYNIIHELSTKSNLPMPKIWLINTPMANAFATGRNPENASVAVTSGILELLDDRELRGVLAHELSHISNRDILITSIAATIATAIGYIANMIQYLTIWGAADTDKKRNNPLAMLFLAILLPIAATMIQLAISRSREYLADETGAELCHDPLALASALEKIHFNVKENHLNEKDTVKAATSSLFIINPFLSLDWASLFSTHPSIGKRIAKLKELYEKNSLN